MSHSLSVVLSAVAFVLLSRCDAGKGPNVLPRETPDAFEVFAHFPYAVAISDADNDTIFECLTATRKDFDPEAKTVTYVWSISDTPGKRDGAPVYMITDGAWTRIETTTATGLVLVSCGGRSTYATETATPSELSHVEVLVEARWLSPHSWCDPGGHKLYCWQKQANRRLTELTLLQLLLLVTDIILWR